MCTGLHAMYPLLLSQFMNLELSRQICTQKQMSNFMKIRSVIVELFHVGGQTRLKTVLNLSLLFFNLLNTELNPICQ
jgi:hypothetical protein